MKIKLLLFFVLSCSVTIKAQSDTLKKYANGNILLRHNATMQLMSPAGVNLGGWKTLEQNINQWDKKLSVVRGPDSMEE